MQRVIVAAQVKLLDVGIADLLHPDGLPYATLRRIPDASTVEPLLAARLAARLARIAYRHVDRGDGFRIAQDQEGIRDVKGKRRVATLMASDRIAIDDALARVVDGPEVEQIALAGPLEHRDAAPVPDGLVWLELMAHTGKRCFGREGNEDLSGVDGLLIVALVLVGTYRAFPPAVEVGVRLAPHLGTGVFPQDGIGVKRFAPGREQRRELVIGMRLQGARGRALEIEHRPHASILSDAPAGETARLVVQSYAI